MDSRSRHDDIKKSFTLDPNYNAVTAKINHALSLKRNGYLSRGRQALESKDLANLEDPEVRALLKKMFPDNHNETLPSLPEDAPLISIDTDHLENSIKACDNGSGASPSGWTGAHLRVLSMDPDCMVGIKTLVSDIANGLLDDRFKDYLLGSRLVAPHKLDKSERRSKLDGGLRPVCIGDLFFKVAATYLVNGTKEQQAIVLVPTNYALGVPGGLEFIGSVSNELLNDKKLKVCGLKKDVYNAHNEIDRKETLQRLFLQRSLSFMWRLAHWSYSYASPVYILSRENHIIEKLYSKQGVRQGDPLSQPLFCIGFTPTLNQLKRTNANVTVLADADDVMLIGKPDDVLSFSTALDSKLSDINLRSRPDKEKFIWLHDPDDDDVQTARDLLPKDTEVTYDGLIFAGCPIVKDSNANIVDELLEPLMERLNSFLNILLHRSMPQHDAFHFLQQCANTRANHLARVVPPDALVGFSREFDRTIKSTFSTLIGVSTLSKPERLQVSMPFRNGGFGLRSLLRIRHPAYIGAAAATSPLWLNLLGAEAKHTMYAVTVNKSIDRLRAKVASQPDSELYLPAADDPDFMDFFTTGKGKALTRVQGKLTAFMEAKSYGWWMNKLSYGDRARVLSASQGPSSAWLTGSGKIRMNNLYFETAANLRLRPGDCSKLADRSSISVTLMKTRHRLIAKRIAVWARRAGATSVKLEPAHLDPDSSKRPDIDIVMDSDRYLVDVAVIHPTCQTYIQKAHKQLGACDIMIDTKLDKYDELASRLDAQIVPAVIETYGALSKPCKKLFKTIADYSLEDPYCLFTRDEILRGLTVEVSTILQIWNAKLITRRDD